MVKQILTRIKDELEAMQQSRVQKCNKKNFTNGLRMCQQGNVKYKKHGKEYCINTAMEMQGAEWH